MRKPLAALQNRVDEILGKNVTTSNLRYMIYSGHDDTVLNLMEWLVPNNAVMEWVDFAS